VATEIGKLIAVFTAETAQFDAATKRVASSMRQTASSVNASQKNISQGELSLGQQLKASESLQRQRSAALVRQWKEQERSALRAATGAKSFTQITQELSTSIAALQGPLGGIAGRLSSIGSLAAGGGALTALAAALAAIGGSAFGIYKLVSATSEATGKFHDLSQQTGFSVETLSALGNAAETSGGSIDTIAASLGIFQRHMEEANEGNKETSRLLKALNIDFQDNEKALRQSFTTLSKLPQGAQQSALSMKLFGRSGREVQGVFKEAGGDIDKFTAKLEEMGILITTRAARKGDELSDTITRLRQKFEATGRSIANEFTPLVTDGLRTFSRWLNDNQKELISTAREVANLVKEISSLASFLHSISPLRLEIQIIRTLKNFVQDVFPTGAPGPPAGQSLFGQFREFMGRGPTPTGSRGALVPVDINKIPTQTKAQIGATAKASRDLAQKEADEIRRIQNALKSLQSGGGGGGGGPDPAAEARRLAELQLRATLDALKAQETALNRSLSTRRVSLEQYTTDAIALAIKERNETINGLENEEKQAAKLKKGGAVALAEIDLRKREAERKSADAVTKYIDNLLEDFADRDRIREEGMLRVHEIVGRQESDLWQALADQRVINQETAVKAIGQIEMQGLIERMAIARSEFNRARGDKTKQIEASMRMGEIESEIGRLSADNDRKAATALKERLAAQRDFNATLEQTLSNVRLQGIELQKQSILHQLDITGAGLGRGRRARRAVDVLDIQQENIRIELAKRELFLNLLKDMERKSFDERKQLYSAFITEREQLEAQHVQLIKEINERQLIELRESIERFSGDLTNALDRGLTEGFRSGIKGGTLEFIKGILEMIKSRALLNLETAIADAITKGFAGGGAAGGGGGFLSGLLRTIIGAFIGGIGGGTHLGGGAGPGGGIGGIPAIGTPGRASGGSVSAGQLYRVNERGEEYFMPLRSGHVYNQSQVRNMSNKTVVNNINVTVPAPRMQTFRQKRSQRELAEKIAALLT
jgi:hypothetical protein